MTTTLLMLGPLRLRVDGQEQAWPPERRFQLLAYLAACADWVSRDQLQHLFWAEHPPDAARSNLRQLLRRVRLLGLPGLEVTRDGVRWPVDTDLAAFRQAVSHRRWPEALRLYGGPFLSGQEADGTGEFAAWLSRQRAQLQGAWRTASLQRAGELQQEGWHLEAAELLQPLLDADELDEEAMRAQVGALLQAGGRERALRACQDFARRLRDELGVEPGAELAGLLASLQRPGALPSAPPPPARPDPGLPSVPTSFIGRDLELAEMARLLAQPGVRLLTVTGPGGIGKTRLAGEAARLLAPDFPQGVHFVSLEALSDPALIAACIAERLGLPPGGRADALEQLLDWLGRRRLLLLLDNHEHLLDGAGVVAALLRGCPELRLIVTSRERLGLAGEWLLPLVGLDHPAAAEVGEVEGRHFDAVQLFVERARRVQPDFRAAGAALPLVLRVCWLVEGSPLALELAAVWVRSLPLDEVVREIEANLDFLTSGERGGGARHRSLRAVFEHSWRLLTPEAQAVLARLSVFRGGFRLTAARQVAGASPALLAALVDASLLRLGAAGRFSVHMPLVQYMREKLAADPQAQRELELRHGRCYLTLLRERGNEIFGPQGGAALSALDEEQENIRAAWNGAAAWPEALQAAVAQGALYHDRRARFQEGFASFERAACALSADQPAQRHLLGDVLIRQGWFAMRLGRQREAQQLAARGLALVPPDSASALHGHNALGNIAEHTGDYARATGHFQAAIQLAGAHGFPARRADLLTHLAGVETAQGSCGPAELRLQESLAAYAELGYPVGLVFGLLQQGRLLLVRGRLDEAGSAFRRGLALARRLGVHQRVPPLLHGLAAVAFQRGALGEARQLAQEELQQARREGDHSARTAALGLLGRLSAAQGDGAAARAQLTQGLQLARWGGETPRLLELLTFLAEWRLQAQAQWAASVLRLVERHPATEFRVKTLARHCLQAAGAPPAAPGPLPELDGLVTALLADPGPVPAGSAETDEL